MGSPFAFLLRTLIAGILLLAWHVPCSAYDYPVRLETSPKGTGFELYAVNDGPAPVNVVIELTRSKNIGFAPNVIGSKSSHLIAPNSRKFISLAVPMKRGRPTEIAFRHRFVFGDYAAPVDLGYKYRLPIHDGIQGVLRPFSGIPYADTFLDSSRAVEVLVPIGTPVVAARDGVVFDAKGYEGDDAPSRPSKVGNYIAVLHSDGSWAVYGWLQPGASLPKPGAAVVAGQTIGSVALNEVSADTFVHFVVMRNLAATTVGSVPLKFATTANPDIDPVTFVGPVAQDLIPKFATPASAVDDHWRPTEANIPTPPVVSDYGDEDMSPLQRQALYRQRIVEHATAGRDTVGDSQLLIFIAGTAIVLSMFALFIVFGGSSKSQSSGGPLSLLWSLLHGKQPQGSLPFDPADARPPSHDNAASGDEQAPSDEPAIIAPTMPGHPAGPTHFDGLLPQPKIADNALAATHAGEVGPTIPGQRLHDPATLELIRHVSSATPLGMISSHAVPASSLYSGGKADQVVDFVLVRATDATIVALLLRSENSALNNALVGAGFNVILLPPAPTSDAVKQLIHSVVKQ